MCVTIKLLDSSFMSEFYFTEDRIGLADKYLREGKYQCRDIGCMYGDGTRESITEYLFYLTNNHMCQEERDIVYGRERSISVGDIVEVDGINMLCDFVGWVEV